MRVLLSSFVVFAACTPGQIIMPPPAPVEPPALTRVTVTPVDTTRPMSSTVMSSVSALGLSLVSGQVAVVATDGVTVRIGTTMTPVPVGAMGADSLGTVRRIGRRGAASLWLTSTGVFLERAGRLLRSPLSDSLPLPQVKAIDVVGEGDAETWWVRTDAAVLRVAGGALDSIALEDPNGSGVLKAVVGRDASTAVVVRGERLYLVDVAAPKVTVLAKGLGTVTQSARLGDGHIVFATADGLVRVAPSNDVSLMVFGASAGVNDVAVDGDGALVQSNGQLFSLLVDEVKVLGDVASPVVSGVVRDTAGAVFTLDGQTLERLATTAEEQPVVFADVKPFFTAHCVSCHRSGANYAPIIDFATYAKAKMWAVQSLARAQNADTPMPPASSGLLRPSQYAVLSRWVQGGMLP